MDIKLEEHPEKNKNGPFQWDSHKDLLRRHQEICWDADHFHKNVVKNDDAYRKCKTCGKDWNNSAEAYFRNSGNRNRMPKPTNTQELTARYLAAGAGFKPEEQFFALLNAASHVAKNKVKPGELNLGYIHSHLRDSLYQNQPMEPLADDKAPF